MDRTVHTVEISMIPNIVVKANIIPGVAGTLEMQAAIEYWKTQQRQEGVSDRDIRMVEEAIQDSLNGEDMDDFGRRYFVLNAFAPENSSVLQIGITTLPEIFGFDEFQEIEHFEVHYAKNLKKLPISMSLMTKIRHFEINYCGLEEIEGDLIRNNPDIGFFSVPENNLSTIPPEISDLRNIETLDLSYNKIKFLPDAIGNLRNTEALDPELKLNDNELCTLPVSIEMLTEWSIAYRNNPFEMQNPFGCIPRHQDSGKALIIQLSQYKNYFRSPEDAQWLDLTMRLMQITGACWHSKTQPDDASTLLHIFHFPRCAMLEYTPRASSHGGQVNRVRSGTKQPQPFSASAEGPARRPCFLFPCLIKYLRASGGQKTLPHWLGKRMWLRRSRMRLSGSNCTMPIC